MKADFYDILAILGAAVLSIGVALLSVPAGIIVAGVTLIIFGFIGAAGRPEQEAKKK